MNTLNMLITKEGRFYYLWEHGTFLGRYSGSEEPIKRAEELVERRGGTITIDLRKPPHRGEHQ
jgi:hypothetical protein